jgi:hypothetical protein
MPSAATMAARDVFWRVAKVAWPRPRRCSDWASRSRCRHQDRFGGVLDTTRSGKEMAEGRSRRLLADLARKAASPTPEVMTAALRVKQELLGAMPGASAWVRKSPRHSQRRHRGSGG